MVSTIQISHNYTYIPSFLSFPPLPHPIPPGHHRAADWAPCATKQLLSSYASAPDGVSMLVLLVLLSPSPPWPQVHSLHLQIFKCISLSTLPPKLGIQSRTHLSFSHLSSSELYQFSLLKGSHSVTFLLSSLLLP